MHYYRINSFLSDLSILKRSLQHFHQYITVLQHSIVLRSQSPPETTIRIFPRNLECFWKIIHKKVISPDGFLEILSVYPVGYALGYHLLHGYITT